MALHEVFSQAVLDPFALVVIAAATGWYVWASRRRPSWPDWRAWCFIAAQVVLLVATCSGVAAHDRDFAVHAVQQVLVVMVAPFFLALSAPVTLLMQTGGPRTAAVTGRILKLRGAAPPVIGWAFYGACVCVLYFTGLYADTVRNSTVRGAVLCVLFLAGCAFWAPLFGQRIGYWWKMAYLVFSMPFHTIIGMSLESQTQSIAPNTPVSTLHTGGGILWVAGEAVGLLGAIAVFVLWLRAEEQKAKEHDRVSGAAAAHQLAHWRAAREAAARAAGPLT